jgi:cbb3-type cytochrome oxidase subunit 3
LYFFLLFLGLMYTAFSRKNYLIEFNNNNTSLK